MATDAPSRRCPMARSTRSPNAGARSGRSWRRSGRALRDRELGHEAPVVAPRDVELAHLGRHETGPEERVIEPDERRQVPGHGPRGGEAPAHPLMDIAQTPA